VRDPAVLLFVRRGSPPDPSEQLGADHEQGPRQRGGHDIVVVFVQVDDADDLDITDLYLISDKEELFFRRSKNGPNWIVTGEFWIGPQAS
jgi:hypothetical protein